MKRDNIHYSLNSLMGFNKPLNLIFSGRDAGKTCVIANDIIKKKIIHNRLKKR